jgi:hypothetical protein
MTDHGALLFGALVVLACARVFALVACHDTGRWSKLWLAAVMFAVVIAAAATGR